MTGSSPSASSSGETASTSPERFSRRRVLHIGIVLFMLLATTLAGFASRGTSAPLGKDAPPDAFSSARAAEAAAPVVEKPRPVGSPENTAAADHLTERFEDMGFGVERQEGIGSRAGEGDHAGESSVAFTRNLVATRPGTDSTGTIVLATHIDSVPAAPGASDAGVGVAVILETLRALGPEAERNDLVVLIVDGEEDGLLGSLSFLEDGAEELAEPIVVLNHEARGTSGRPVITRWNGPMDEVMSSIPSPEAESFTNALFGFIPNDTDFTEYRDAGWWGMDMAITDDSWAYHTPQDDLDHLDRSTLQHYGDMTLAMTGDLLARDLGAMDEGGADSALTTAPWGILGVPTTLLLALAIAAPLAVLLGIGIAARRRVVTWRASLAATSGALLALILGVALAVGAWIAAAALRPGMLSTVVGEPVIAWPFIAAEVGCAIAGVLLGWAVLRRWLSDTALALGGALIASVLAAAITFLSPELGGWLMVPVAVAAFGALGLVALGIEERGARPWWIARVLTGVIAVLPMGWVLGTQLSALGEFGITSSSGMLALVVVVSLLGTAPALVGIGRSASGRAPRAARRRLLVPALALLLVVALSGTGLVVQGRAGEPAQEEVVAEVDADAGTTEWTATGATDWGRRLDGTTADADGLRPPECSADVSDADGDGRRIRVEVSSPRDAQRVTIGLTKGTMRDVRVDDSTVPTDADGARNLRLTGVAPGQSFVLEFTATSDTAKLRCTDETHDPAAAPGWNPAPDDVSLVQPAIRVTGTTSL